VRYISYHLARSGRRGSWLVAEIGTAKVEMNPLVVAYGTLDQYMKGTALEGSWQAFTSTAEPS
jgi:hypothetical protein